MVIDKRECRIRLIFLIAENRECEMNVTLHVASIISVKKEPVHGDVT